MSDELRERVATALTSDGPLSTDLAVSRVLAALGLDDLDAAIRRCAEALERCGWTVSAPGDPPSTGLADLAFGLRAALTPPERCASPTHAPADGNR